MGIGGRITNTENALAAGNVLSNEPGYYEDGAFGIRIENIFIVKNIEETTYKLKDKRFLGFENVTMVPYCNNLIDSSLLTQREKDWVNEMNRQTIEKTRNLLQDDALALDWLKRNTEPLV
jgi:Xaa-Pro aminopeptidase